VVNESHDHHTLTLTLVVSGNESHDHCPLTLFPSSHNINIIYHFYNRSTIDNMDNKFGLVTLYLLFTMLKIVLIVILLLNRYFNLICWNACFVVFTYTLGIEYRMIVYLTWLIV